MGAGVCSGGREEMEGENAGRDSWVLGEGHLEGRVET